MVIRALLEALFAPKSFPVLALQVHASSCYTLSAYSLKDNAICATVLLGLLSEGIFLGDFLKISLGPPFALFQKMRVLGDLAKTAKTWPYGNFRSRFFAPKSSPVFALEVHTN